MALGADSAGLATALCKYKHARAVTKTATAAAAAAATALTATVAVTVTVTITAHSNSNSNGNDNSCNHSILNKDSITLNKPCSRHSDLQTCQHNAKLLRLLHTTQWLWILDSKAFWAAAESQQEASFVPFCESGVSSTCDTDGLTRVTIDLLVAFVLVYFGVICCILVYKLKMFNSLPYSRAQAAIVFYRFQARHPLITCSCQTTFWLQHLHSFFLQPTPGFT